MKGIGNIKKKNGMKKMLEKVDFSEKAWFFWKIRIFAISVLNFYVKEPYIFFETFSR